MSQATHHCTCGAPHYPAPTITAADAHFHQVDIWFTELCRAALAGPQPESEAGPQLSNTTTPTDPSSHDFWSSSRPRFPTGIRPDQIFDSFWCPELWAGLEHSIWSPANDPLPPSTRRNRPQLSRLPKPGSAPGTWLLPKLAPLTPPLQVRPAPPPSPSTPDTPDLLWPQAGLEPSLFPRLASPPPVSSPPPSTSAASFASASTSPPSPPLAGLEASLHAFSAPPAGPGRSAPSPPPTISRPPPPRSSSASASTTPPPPQPRAGIEASRWAPLPSPAATPTPPPRPQAGLETSRWASPAPVASSSAAAASTTPTPPPPPSASPQPPLGLQAKQFEGDRLFPVPLYHKDEKSVRKPTRRNGRKW
ncbi:MAG: hypothetical protein M1814_001224 [Vezdaea aestivalis]|nr:MAG: hypothetical protein M1814_001224 [Vezdaea aestivalis]